MPTEDAATPTRSSSGSRSRRTCRPSTTCSSPRARHRATPGAPRTGGGARLDRLAAGPTGRAAGWRAGTPGCSASSLLRGAWLNLLFVHPERPAPGVGAALLDLAKALRPQGFGLRVYQANTRARDFYRRHGLVELETTDGSSHDDDEPDLQMAWLGEDPLAYLRGRIDEVDDEPPSSWPGGWRSPRPCRTTRRSGGGGPRPGPRGRDRRADGEPTSPGLAQDRIAAVMHTVIAESLAAWEDASGPE